MLMDKLRIALLSRLLSCPARSPCELSDFPHVLNLTFLLLLELPPGASSPFQYQCSRLEVKRVCEGGGLCAGGRAGNGEGAFGAVCSHRKEGMAAAPQAGPSGKHMAEMDPQRMFLKQLLGRAGAF